MSTQIGPVRPEHIAALARLRQAFWTDQAAKGLRELLPDCDEAALVKLTGRLRTHLLVAETHERLIGYVFGQTKILPGGTQRLVSTIEEIMMTPDRRGDGVGRRLVEAAVERFRQDNAERIQLRVLAENAGAFAFWRQLGFAPYVTTLERSASA